jgi:succinate dehydrogenase / fumarate reductase, cytochrome b subunit
MARPNSRPVFLNLLQIKLPVTGVVSIAHRISGMLLFISLPIALYLLGLSLSSESGFVQTVAIVQSLPFRLLALLALWALLHHLLAGLRFLLIDLDIGVHKTPARASAFGVILGGVLLALFAGLLL